MQFTRRPGERLIEMAKVTCVRSMISDALPHVRGRNLMTANAAQQSERRVGHVAVVTAATGRGRRVMRVRADSGGESLMTLQTCVIGIHFRFQLRAPGPFRQASSLVIGGVHFMA